MVFSSFTFVLVFFPIVCLLYFLTPKKLRKVRNAILLVFSLIFYMWGEPKGIFVMLGVIASSYLSAILIDLCERKNKTALRRLCLIADIAVCLGALFYFKYTGWMVESFNALFSKSLTVPQIIMPIGISFFTFQSMSYVFDVYMKTVPVQKNVLYVALYVSLFPQLVAGPIVRYQTVALEIENRNENLDDIYVGVQRFIIGFGKKLLLANTFGSEAEKIFAMASYQRGTPTAWMGAVLYALQIFYDFSAYSDMAIGMGRMFGFHFLENFNYPYISRSVTEFWRRWHISLSTWFRDYIYIPLGGNRRGKARQILNILIVWALTGLWHGASWNFVIWGLYFAFFLIAEKLFLGKILEKLPGFLRHIYALLLILVGWVIFNCTDLVSLTAYLSDMFKMQGDFSYAVLCVRQNIPEFVFGILLCMPYANNLVFGKLRNVPICEILRCVWLSAVLVLSVLSLTGSTFNAFIYFRF